MVKFPLLLSLSTLPAHWAGTMLVLIKANSSHIMAMVYSLECTVASHVECTHDHLAK